MSNIVVGGLILDQSNLVCYHYFLQKYCVAAIKQACILKHVS